MKARPIPFSVPMAKAVRDLRKSQTRRALKTQPAIAPHHEPVKAECLGGLKWVFLTHTDRPGYSWATGDVLCPYGEPGDLLWVREPWRVGKPHDAKKPRDILPPLIKRGKGVTVLYEAGGWRSVGPPDREEPIYPDNEAMPTWAGRYRHARFMPRWASRLTLRLTDVRVERLQEISETDALAEGVTMPEPEREEFDASLCSRCGGTLLYTHVNPINGGVTFDRDCTDCSTARDRYRHLWNYINGEDAWAANPWVYALTFSVIKANVDEVLKREAA